MLNYKDKQLDDDKKFDNSTPHPVIDDDDDLESLKAAKAVREGVAMERVISECTLRCRKFAKSICECVPVEGVVSEASL